MVFNYEDGSSIFSETAVNFYQTILSHIPEHNNFRSNRHEIPKVQALNSPMVSVHDDDKDDDDDDDDDDISKLCIYWDNVRNVFPSAP
jgi:hypothetical protein